MGLVLTRKPSNPGVVFRDKQGAEIARVTVTKFGAHVRLSIEAAPEIVILREEIDFEPPEPPPAATRSAA